MLAKTRWGYETFATGGNEQAAIYAGIPTRWVRIRAYLLSSLCATIAGLMAVAQDKGISPQSGLSAELIVIAAVIIGGASILGGRGRVIGSFLGALLTVLINKVLREGLPITRTVDRRRPGSAGAGGLHAAGRRGAGVPRRPPDHRGADRAVHHPPPACRRACGRGCAACRRRRRSKSAASPSKARRPRAAMATDKALTRARLRQVPGAARRAGDHPDRRASGWSASISGPDYWWHLPNTFAILLNYTELALIAVGLTYVIAAGDIDLSVGAVLALAGSTAAYCAEGARPRSLAGDRASGLLAGVARRRSSTALLTVGFGLPAFIATLGMFYIARGVASWIVAGQQLTGFTESFNLIGRKVGDILDLPRTSPHPSGFSAPSPRWSACRRSG